MTRREAPLSVLKDLAEAFSQYPPEHMTGNQEDALAAYRAATAPLRSRAEVDASKLHCASAYFNGNMGIDTARAEWARLCSEPTSDPNPSGPGGESALVERVLASDEPDPCGCEQSEALLQRLGRIRSLAVTYPSNEPHTALGAIRKVCG